MRRDCFSYRDLRQPSAILLRYAHWKFTNSIFFRYDGYPRFNL